MKYLFLSVFLILLSTQALATQETKATYQAGLATAINDNTAGEITPADIRGEFTDLSDSVIFIDSAASVTTLTGTSASASCLAVGPSGATNPALKVDCSDASAEVGLVITGNDAAADFASIACIAADGTCNTIIRGLGSTRGINFDPDGDLDTQHLFRSHYVQFTPDTNGTASQDRFNFTSAADTGLTAGGSTKTVHFNLSAVRQHASGTTVTNDDAFYISAPTYAFESAGTVTNAATLRVTGAPLAGTNATITNSRALHIDSGVSQHDDGVTIPAVAVSALGTPPAGTIKIISDAASATDCVTGSGSTYNLCVYNGSAWVDM